ncbi:MAG: alpha/beta hydrolase [Rhodospirillales bacterium]|nr:alpha/beta hydrolase [Rhodospirillales bacterium]
MGRADSRAKPEPFNGSGFFRSALRNSGPDHWQSHWEAKLPGARRVVQDDWDHPDKDSWIANLDACVAEADAPIVLIAHSLACALVAHWAGASEHVAKVHSALLVAPADVDSELHTPPVARCFAPMPLDLLPFKSLVLASQDDPYVEPLRAHFFASCWYSGFLDVGALGHVNSDSHLGDWDEGRALLEQILPPS